MKKLLTDKRFWTLVAAIVAALSAFFMGGCTGYLKVSRSGLHHDTVRYEQVIKSRKSSVVAWHSPVSEKTPGIGSPMKSLKPVFITASAMSIPQSRLSFISDFQLPASSPILSMRSITTSSLISEKLMWIYSMLPPLLRQSLQLENRRSKSDCLRCTVQSVALPLDSRNPLSDPSKLTPVALVAGTLAIPLSRTSRSKRGGRRKGRPRPSTKTVSLGGHHL